jgi:hypothetical protein
LSIRDSATNYRGAERGEDNASADPNIAFGDVRVPRPRGI